MKHTFLKVAVVATVLCLTLPGYAKKYSDDPAGQGTSTVGTGGDYASILEASLDFNTTAATGSWTLEILNDLTETAPVFFGKTVDESYTNTIKPAAGTNPIVTFTTSSTTLAGNLVFGASFNTISDLIPTNNFIVDGSNNGTNSRNLTLTNTSTSNSAWVYTVRVYGDCDNFTIKNCNVYNRTTTVNFSSAIGFCSRVTTGATIALHPDNAKVQNCYVVASTILNGSSAAITFEASGTLPTGSVATGLEITNCFVQTYNMPREIFINNAVGQGVISSNTVRGYLPTGVSVGLWPINVNGSNNLDNFVISNNVIDEMITGRTSAGDGIIAMNLNGKAGGNGTVGKFYVYNNTISGYNLNGTPNALGVKVTGIRHYSTSEGFYVFNNSINVPNLGNWTGLANCYAIGFESGAYAGPAVVKNNIIRINNNRFVAIAKYNSTLTTAVVSDYNDIVTLSGSSVGRFGSTYYGDLASWQAIPLANLDANTQTINPMTSTPGHWISETNHHFTDSNVAGLAAGTPITTPFALNTDIDGDPRSATTPWRGIDENGSLVPVELSGFDAE